MTDSLGTSVYLVFVEGQWRIDRVINRWIDPS